MHPEFHRSFDEVTRAMDLARANRPRLLCHPFDPRYPEDPPDFQPPDSMQSAPAIECHGLDTPERVFFYEQDFYVLSNFSSFTLMWKDRRFDTSEAAYHWEKFYHVGQGIDIKERILHAPSAHEAYRIAAENKPLRRVDWDEVKVDIMREILHAKVHQHAYVKKKLLATGDRELVENSWRDDFWGWGPNRDGQNVLGKLWMDVRETVRIEDKIDAMTPEEVTAYLHANGIDEKRLHAGLSKVRATVEAAWAKRQGGAPDLGDPTSKN